MKIEECIEIVEMERQNICPRRGDYLDALDNLLKLASAYKEAVEALREYAEAAGEVHEDACPMDDTCECKWKSTNDKVKQALAVAKTLGVE